MATLNPPSYTFCKAYQMRFLCPRLLTSAKYCIIIPEKGLIHFVILWIFLPLQTKSNTIKSWWPTESQSLLLNVVPLFYPKNLSWASCDRQIFGTSHSNFVNTLIHRFFTASSFATWPMSKYTLYGQNTNLSSLTWNWLDLLLRFLTLSKQWISVTNSQRHGKLVRNDFASWMK